MQIIQFNFIYLFIFSLLSPPTSFLPGSSRGFFLLKGKLFSNCHQAFDQRDLFDYWGFLYTIVGSTLHYKATLGQLFELYK